MQRMINHIRHYSWGSHISMTELYGIANPEDKPMAEMWMGAHPSCSSEIDIDGQIISLRQLIASDAENILGTKVNRRFAELPFLFKVLAAAQPLSIQVHPNKQAAEKGFAKEEKASIPISAANRNYKDANHKPELVFTLTPFSAMNGFRPFAEIATLLRSVADAHPIISQFIYQPNATLLKELFSTLLKLAGAEKAQALTILNSVLDKPGNGEPWQTIRLIKHYYPDDMGLFSPLLLNVIYLEPGEAMFLAAETPHAYIHGTALEVMANSDNVLRAGLTSKYIDVAELIANIKFEAKPLDCLRLKPVKEENYVVYPVPVDDFSFSLHEVTPVEQVLTQQSAAIVFCIDGMVSLTKGKQTITLTKGESIFIAAYESPVSFNGKGKIARIYNKLI